MCNKCDHRDVCGKYKSTGGHVNTCDHFQQTIKSNWKYYNKQGIAVCQNCSFERNLDENFGRAISCPNCGADMRGENYHG